MKHLIIILAMLTLIGCTTYKGAKVTEGTDLALGLRLPGAEGMAQLDLLNYLSGFHLGVQKDAGLTLTYTVTDKSSFIGIFNYDVEKTISATIDPSQKE